MRTGLAVFTAATLASAIAQAGRGAPLLKYLPDDTTAVAVIDVAHAHNTKMFKSGIELLGKSVAEVDQLTKDGAIDKLDTIVMGTSGSSDSKWSGGHVVVVVEGKIDKLIDAAKKKTKETHDGVTYWTLEDGGELAVIDKRAIATGAGDMPALIDRIHGKAKAKGAQLARAMLAAATLGTDAFAGISLDKSARDTLANAAGVDTSWVVGSVAMASKLTIDVKLKVADDASAEKAVQTLTTKLGDPATKGQLEAMVGKDFTDSLKIDRDHTIVRVSATLTADELDHIGTFLKLAL
jgi:hypothetical protein